MNGKEESKPPVSFPIKPPGPPKIWKVVECVIKGKGDTPIKFSIQEVPEDRYEDVVEHMCTYFIVDEPLCKSLNGKDDPGFVETFRRLWREIIGQGLAVAAFVEDPNGGKPIIAGCNILAFCHKDDKQTFDRFTSIKEKRIKDAIMDICERAKVYEKYGVDRYIGALGLSVHPSFRGAALGGHLLRAREDIGREYKISVTATAFTSAISQKLAERCGYETLVEENYAEMLDEEGKPIFPGIETKALKVMAKRLY